MPPEDETKAQALGGSLYPELDTNDYVGSFHFRVTVPNIAGDVNQAFTSVGGLPEPIEGLGRAGRRSEAAGGRDELGVSVNLHRIYNGNDAFYDWRMEVEAGTITRRDVKIEWLRADGQVVETAIIRGCYPSSWELPPLDASGSEGAEEIITLDGASVDRS